MDAATHIAPKIDTSTRSYLGQVYYDHMGNTLAHVGHETEGLAKQAIEKTNDQLHGRWSFAVVKTMRREGNNQIWANFLLFPDGKTRKLVAGEVAAFARKSKGTWITVAQVAKVFPAVRPAPDTRFPWKNGAVNTKTERFANMLELEKWLTKVGPNDLLFVATPAGTTLPPDEEALFLMAAIVSK